MEAKKILLIDDDVDIILANTTVLENKGYQVISAYNGKEGLKKALAENPDLIVLDVMMSTHSEGFDVSRELRKVPATKNTPIIMLTSVNTTVPFKFEPDATYLPVNIFLEKPVSPADLLLQIETILAK
ncbi:MAG: response regulator [Smithellaceae bacterium]|nr:response regulator [Smithellaceae bacterium]